MTFIKEPLEVDFFVEPLALSDTERQAISEFIKNHKNKKVQKKVQKEASHKEALLSFA